MECLQADATPRDAIRVLLYDEALDPVKTESYERGDPQRKPVEIDPSASRERDNRLRYEGGPFDGHRGVRVGAHVTPHSPLWREILEMYDEERGELLWEPDSPIHGRVIELPQAVAGLAGAEGAPNAEYGVVWTFDRGPRERPTTPAEPATNGGETDKPGPTTVHVLSGTEHDELSQRVLGPLLQAVVDHEAERGEHAADSDHPVHRLLAECRARRDTSLAPNQR